MSDPFLSAATHRTLDTATDGAASALEALDITDGTMDTTAVSYASFELVRSSVVDEATGEQLSSEVVTRGVTRLETLHFIVRGAPIIQLRRRTINYKHFRLVGFTKVGVDLVEMGDYAPGDGTFAMPPAKIPNMYLATGRYRIEISYSAGGLGQDQEVFAMTHEFEVV